MSRSWTAMILNVESLRTTRKAFRDFMAFLNATDSELSAGEMVFGELAGNAIVHGMPGETAVRAVTETRGVRLIVKSRGHRFTFEPRAPLATQTSGRGFQIVASLAQEVSIAHVDCINAIAVLVPLEAANACELAPGSPTGRTETGREVTMQ